MSFPWSSAAKEESASSDSEDDEIRAVQAMADRGLAVGDKLGGDGLSTDEEEEAEKEERARKEKEREKKRKKKLTKERAKKQQEAESSDEKAVADSDDEAFEDKGGEGEPYGVEEEEEPVLLRRDGKPMNEIDIFIHHTMQERIREQRKARAAEAELAMERAAEGAEHGTRSGQLRTMQLLIERKMSNIMMMTSIFGIVMMMAQLQISWNGDSVEDNVCSQMIKAMITASTILLEYQLYQYYRSSLDNLQKIYNFPQLLLSDSPYYYMYLAEAFVCLFHTPPFFNGLLSDKFSLFMFMRFYSIFRYWRDGNPVYVKYDTYRSEDINNLYQFEMNTPFYVKFKFWESPLFVVFQFFCMMFFISVYCFYVVERELVPHVYDFQSTMWFMSITMTTVGYNAVTPNDVLGRSFAMSGAFLAMLTLAMMSAILARFIELQFREQVALGWSYRKEDKKARDRKAAIVIQKFYRMFAVSRSRWVTRRKLHPRAAHQFYAALADFQETRIRYNESMVQGEGGYSLIMDRIEAAKEDMHSQMDVIESRVDETAQNFMENMVAQLTKLEEQQAVVLNANFESVLKYMRTVEKKLKTIANSPK